jgi:protein pelota
VAEAVHKNIPMTDVKCLLVASPAFIGEDFVRFMMERAKKEGWADILDNKAKIRTVHAASGHKHALMETLKDPSVRTLVSETSAMRETELMETFMTLMSTDPDRAYYGLDDVRRANDAGAIQTLMVSDSLFKSNDIQTRSKYVNFVDEVKATGAEIVIFSNANVSGEQLTQITGIAAILTYGLPELDEEEEAELYAQTVTQVRSNEDEEDVGEAGVKGLSIEQGKKEKKDKKAKKDKKSKGKGDKKKSKKGSEESSDEEDDIMYI